MEIMEKNGKGKAPRRMVLSDESENGRGFRVLTSGVRIDRYRKNPVLLWMHRRGEVIGWVDDIRVEDGRLTGEPKFDEATELSRTAKAQWEAGSVRACSMGIDIEHVSMEPLDGGGERAVVTRCSLYEVSLVDVPENENSVRLRHDGLVLEPSGLVSLAREGESVNPNTKPKTKEEMNLSEMAVLLGLDAGASEEQVRQRAGELKASHAELAKATAEIKRMKEEREQAELAHVEGLVDAAVREMRITADKKARYVELGKKIGSSALEAVLNDLKPVGRIVETLQHDGENPAAGAWKKLSDVPAAELLSLKERDRALYAKLYKAEYGVDLTQ